MTEVKILWNVDSLVNTIGATRAERNDVENAISNAIEEATRHEENMQSHGHASQFVRSSSYSKAIAHNAYLANAIKSVVKTRQSGFEEQVQETCRNLTETLLSSTECMVCNPGDVYRTISGCCNNLAQSNYGRANQPLIRYMDNAYSDSESLPRGGLSASTLPSPRKVSSVIHRVREPAKDSLATVMLMQFGQFLDHDIDLTPEQGRKLHKSAFYHRYGKRS